jgi:hypothetical protein
VFLFISTKAQVGMELKDSVLKRKPPQMESIKGKKNFRTDTLNLKNSFGNSETYNKMEKPKFVNTDSVHGHLIGKRSLKKDSIVNRKSLLQKLKTGFPTGNISIGYDYGFLPYTVNTPAPGYAFITQGQIATNFFNLPIDVNYFYSTQKNLIGLNNYFKVSYNADRFQDNLHNKIDQNIEGYRNQISQLTGQRQQLMQKMAYTDYLSTTSPDKWPVQKPASPDSSLFSKPDSAQIVSSADFSKPDSSSYANHYLNKDSLNTFNNKKDSINDKAELYKQKSDSVRAEYFKYKTQYDSINNLISNLNQKVEESEKLPRNNYGSVIGKIPYISNFQNFLSGVKKFDVGLCYPSYSTFLANNIPVRGINFEYAKKNRFFAFTYGTTVSTLLYNSKTPEGFLQNTKNAYNYFDFSNVSVGRKILAAKFGVGTKENNHFFAGFLIGKGQANYLNNNNEDVSFKTKESNIVLEADGRFKYKSAFTLDVILGKSSLKQENLNYDMLQQSVKELFSKYRSYALLTKIGTGIKVTKTSINFSVRWIDPFFKGFGTGFIRSDNLRYELKVDQPITSKIKYTVQLRYEEDNLLKLMNYKNTFFSINNTLSLKLTRSLTLRGSYVPLIRTLKSETFSFKSKNSITTGIITFTPRTKDVNIQMNLLYNYYLVNTDTLQINFQNICYSHQVIFKNGFKTGMNVTWFKNNLSDSLNNNILLGVLDVGYQFKNGSSVSLAGKSAYKMNNKLYPGFLIKCGIKLHKSLFWESQAEKFIVGDLFNGYDLTNLKQFPYYFSTRLIFKF